MARREQHADERAFGDGGMPRAAGPQADPASAKLFDLNVERVLEHWGVAEAIREVIANAIDEKLLTNTPEPIVVNDGQAWRIRDFGRGLKYHHLTQNENQEKLRHADLVMGKFGVGLKDALAAFHRRGVLVRILSPHGDIELRQVPKHDFQDVVTLHAAVNPASDAGRRGTEFILTGVTDQDIDQAKSFFLRFTGDEELESTTHGSVLRRKGGQARIYVKGLLVATEANFLFSYNITSLTTALQRALNRERSNVGRTAYQDRVKSILLRSESSAVADQLADDLSRLPLGTNHDEITWMDVQERAVQILAAKQRAVFVTANQMYADAGHIEKARTDGYRVVVVPDKLAYRLPSLRDLAGGKVLNVDAYISEWNRSFEFDFVDPSSLSLIEQRVWSLLPDLLKLSSPHSKWVKTVQISTTMRVDRGNYETEGVWEEAEKRIVVRRSTLDTPQHFARVVLHEIGHASSKGAEHFTREFESSIDELLGLSGAAAAERQPGSTK